MAARVAVVDGRLVVRHVRNATGRCLCGCAAADGTDAGCTVYVGDYLQAAYEISGGDASGAFAWLLSQFSRSRIARKAHKILVASRRDRRATRFTFDRRSRIQWESPVEAATPSPVCVCPVDASGRLQSAAGCAVCAAFAKFEVAS